MLRARHNSAHRQRGYTLMEMIAVLAVIAIAGALVLPSITHAFASLQLRTASSGLSQMCKQARLHATYEGHSVALLFGPSDTVPRSMYLVRSDGSTISHAFLSREVKVRVEQRGVWSEDVQPVHFFADGTSEAVQFDLTGPRERHVQFVLDPLTGRTRISQVYDGAAPEPGGVTVFTGGAR